jgi:hypothetical protein
MKIVMNVILVVLAFAWISGVSADKGSKKQSPESIVTCAIAGGSYLILSRSVHDTINTGQCKTWDPDEAPDPCSPCISSLENQGCKIVDVVMGSQLVGEGSSETTVTYLLSCVKP